MTSRRQFLQIGLVATTWPLASKAARAGPAAIGGRTAAVPLYKAVYDRRFPESVAFARRMDGLGVPVHAMDGDITAFWFNDLSRRWTSQPAAVAGLTAHGPMFCLEQLAWERRMRVVFRAEHRPAADGRLQHRLAGPAGMLERAALGSSTAADWAKRIADVAVECPTGRSEITEVTIATGHDASGTFNENLESLFSWVIAPAARA